MSCYWTIKGEKYPAFAWGLERNTLFADGQVLSPANDYIDLYTEEVVLLLSFYATETKVVPSHLLTWHPLVLYSPS